MKFAVSSYVMNDFFELEKEENIATLWLNRPKKRNFMNADYWFGLAEAIEEINNDKDIHAFIVAGRGASFSMGLDIGEFLETNPELLGGNLGEDRHSFYRMVRRMQEGMDKIEQSPKPSICAVHRHCIGGGLDLAASCDIRLASKDALFSLREVRVAIVADMGSLQRLPGIIGEGPTRELALTGRDFSAEEAFQLKLLSAVYDNKEELYEAAKAKAKAISQNPPFVVGGVKQVMNATRHLTVEQGLDYVAHFNAAYMNSKPFQELLQTFTKRQKK